MNTFIEMLMSARDEAHRFHWAARRFAAHIALGELYEGLQELMDDIAEVSMGEQVFDPEQRVPNDVTWPADPIKFVIMLQELLKKYHDLIPPGAIVNLLEDVQVLVATTRYKLERLQ
jgi:DNA-binding ferritin-like protein